MITLTITSNDSAEFESQLMRVAQAYQSRDVLQQIANQRREAAAVEQPATVAGSEVAAELMDEPVKPKRTKKAPVTLEAVAEAQQPVASSVFEEPAPVNEGPKEIKTLEDVRARVMDLYKATSAEQGFEIIKNFGYAKIKDIPVEKYAELAVVIDKAMAQ